MGVNLGNSGSWNRYAYVVGDPVNRNDPTGRDDCPEEEGGPEDPGGCYGDGGGSGGNYCEPGSACYCTQNPDDVSCLPCGPDNECFGGGGGDGAGGTGGSGFADDSIKGDVTTILMNNVKCDQLLFGPNATVASALALFSPIAILPSTALPSNAPPLGAAVVLGTQDKWGSNEPWGEMNGNAIYLNYRYFPNDTVANIGTPWGQTLSAVDVFNHVNKTSLSPLQVEEAVILHELSHIKGGSEVDSAEAKAALISTCIH